MVNSSGAYCLHPFLALAFKSILKQILSFCLFFGLIGHINGTDAATMWKRIWKSWNFIYKLFLSSRSIELLSLRALLKEGSDIHNDLFQFWVAWCTDLGCEPCAQLYFSTSIEERNKKQENVHWNIYACVLDLRSKNILELLLKSNLFKY